MKSSTVAAFTAVLAVTGATLALAPPAAAVPAALPAALPAVGVPAVGPVAAVWLSTCSKRTLREVRLVPNGINIDKTCQRAYFTRNGKVVRNAAVSTGKQGHRTRAGRFRVYRTLNKWAESKLYPGAMMYRPAFFSGGQAIHGSAADWLVRPYPDSHGCVRMRHADVNWMWSRGYARTGTRVYVFVR